MNVLVSLTYCFVFILTTLLIYNSCNAHVASLPDCSNKNVNYTESVIFVSTLDGFITALNGSDNGSILWRYRTGSEEMLSSSIQNQELTGNGLWIRMIPSLSGGLYRYDGKYVDVVPISVEELLTSSFRYSENLVFSGGKKIITFGIHLKTGRAAYECSMSGCRNFTRNDGDDDADELLIVRKHVQTVRAIVPRTGSERWNFSVAEHDLKIAKTVHCHEREPLHVDLNIFAVVPEAIVYATKIHRPDVYVWKTKLSSPIVNIWRWENGVLREVEMFSESQWTWSVPNKVVEPISSPSIYIGMYNNQIYVHESVSMKKIVNMYVDRFNQNLLTGKELQVSVPRIPWKLFPASSDAVAVANTNNMLTVCSNTVISKFLPTSLSEYIDGSGYYLYVENHSGNITIEPEFVEDETHVQIIIISLWFWWKEVTIISITIAIIINVSCFQKNVKERLFINPSLMIGDNGKLNRQLPESDGNTKFKSRFMTEFDLVTTLGKGGFGIVFEARNKIDDCHYAVKKIKLPVCDESRDRVLREVRALAKLDHHNIVRYFNSWVELPPSDWYENISSDMQQDIPVSFTNETISKLSSLEGYTSHIENTNSFKGVTFQKNRKYSFIESEKEDSFIVFKKESVSNDDSNNSTNLNVTKLNSSKKSLIYNSVKSSTQMFLYIQMQLCQRESLREWMYRHSKREKEQIQPIFEQIIHAVEYVHLQGLIHRDLKPSNILFSLDGKIKVGDFGLVTDRANEEIVNSNCDKFDMKKNNRKHTLDVGTHLYMSPEQLKRDCYNYKVDIYSLGVIYFELLNPFNTEMERIQVLKHLRNLKFPEKFQEKFIHEYNLLRLMLSKNPNERPTTIGIRARPPFLHYIDNDKCHFHLPC